MYGFFLSDMLAKYNVYMNILKLLSLILFLSNLLKYLHVAHLLHVSI